MNHVRNVLIEMGVEISNESEFKFRCVRPKRKKAGNILHGVNSASGGGLTALAMIGSAASNGVSGCFYFPLCSAPIHAPFTQIQVDKRGLPVPSHPIAATGMLKGLLMRRQSSQVSSNSALDDEVGPSPVSTAGGHSALALETAHEPVYGDPSTDAGDEVCFSVEITRLSGLNDTYSLDIRRLKGNLRSYKFLYDTLRV